MNDGNRITLRCPICGKRERVMESSIEADLPVRCPLCNVDEIFDIEIEIEVVKGGTK